MEANWAPAEGWTPAILSIKLNTPLEAAELLDTVKQGRDYFYTVRSDPYDNMTKIIEALRSMMARGS